MLDFLKEGKFYSAFLKYLNTMIKNLLAFLFMVCVVTFTMAQTTILDFETPGTSTTFQYFGSTIDGSLNQVIANPNPTGENTSSILSLLWLKLGRVAFQILIRRQLLS